VAAFTASSDAADAEPPSGSQSEGESSPEKEKGSGGEFVLSGSGQTATEPFELEAGLSVFRMTHQGNRNFIVWLLDSNGRRVDLLVNEIGSSSGSKAIRIARSGTYLLQVEADGPWTVQVEY